MKKIPTLFDRDPDDRAHVLRDVNPDAAWVLDGQGVPTRKFDGTCFAKIEHVGWVARREVKPGRQTPPNFAPLERDETTGKTVGWEPATQSSFVKLWREATEGRHDFEPGTYELVGPKVNGNPEQWPVHALVRHGDEELFGVPRDWDGLRGWLLERPRIEGIVWHHPDGRMVKLKRKDFA